MEDLLHTARVIDARHLHEQLGIGILAALLHGCFAQAQSIDLAIVDVLGLAEDVLPELKSLGGLHRQPVIGPVQRSRQPLRKLVVDHGSERAGLSAGNALDQNGRFNGGGQRLCFLHLDISELDVCFARFFLQAVGIRSGLSVERVLLLHLNHEVSSTAEIQPEVDVLLPIGNQLGFAARDSDDAVEADQDDRNDEQEFES